MVSGGARAYNRSGGCVPQRGTGAEPVVRESGDFAPEYESILQFRCSNEGQICLSRPVCPLWNCCVTFCFVKVHFPMLSECCVVLLFE